MAMNSVLTDETMIVTLRVQDLREIVRDVVAEALKVKAQTDLLDMRQVLERYRIGRDAILAAAKRGDLALSRGPRRKLPVRVAELERWLTGKKYVRNREPAPESMEEWERQVSHQLADLQAPVRSHQQQVSDEVDGIIERELAAGRLRITPQQKRGHAPRHRPTKKPR